MRKSTIQSSTVFLLALVVLAGTLEVRNVGGVFHPRASNFQRLSASNILFAAHNGIHGKQLYSYNEITHAIYLVSETAHSVKSIFSLNNGKALVVTKGNELLSTDGSCVGTKFLLGFEPNTFGIAIWNNKALLSYNDEFAWTDGDYVYTIKENELAEAIVEYVACDDKLYFVLESRQSILVWDGITIEETGVTTPAHYLACRGDTLIFTCGSSQEELCIKPPQSPMSKIDLNGLTQISPAYLTVAPNNITYFVAKPINFYAFYMLDTNNSITSLGEDSQDIVPVGAAKRFMITNTYQLDIQPLWVGPLSPLWTNDLIAVEMNTRYIYNISVSPSELLYGTYCIPPTYFQNGVDEELVSAISVANGTALALSGWSLLGEAIIVIGNSNYTHQTSMFGYQNSDARLMGRMPYGDFVVLAIDNAFEGRELYTSHESNAASPGLYAQFDTGECNQSLVVDNNGLHFQTNGDGFFLRIQHNILYYVSANGTRYIYPNISATLPDYMSLTHSCTTPNKLVYTGVYQSTALLQYADPNAKLYNDITSKPVLPNPFYILGCSKISDLVYYMDMDNSSLFAFDIEENSSHFVGLPSANIVTSTVVGNKLLVVAYDEGTFELLHSTNDFDLETVSCVQLHMPSNPPQRFYHLDDYRVAFYAQTSSNTCSIIEIDQDMNCKTLVSWYDDDCYFQSMLVSESGLYVTGRLFNGSEYLFAIYRVDENGSTIFATPDVLPDQLLNERNGVITFVNVDYKTSIMAVKNDSSETIKVVDVNGQFVNYEYMPETDFHYWEFEDEFNFVLIASSPCLNYTWCGTRTNEHCNVDCVNGFCKAATIACEEGFECYEPTGVCMIKLPPTTDTNNCPQPAPQPEQFFRCDNSRGVWIGENIVLEDGDTMVVLGKIEITGDIVVQESNSIVFVLEDSNSAFMLKINGSAIIKGDIVVVVTRELLLNVERTITGTVGTEYKLLEASSIDGSVNALLQIDEYAVASCEKVTAETIHDNKQLTLLLHVDSTHCNLWWIILLCVGGVVILAVLVIIIIMKVRSVRTGVLPFRDTEL